MNKPIAIITARGGSKRIPKKNIKDFMGKPLISYSITAAIDSGVFEKVIVSTDSQEIKDIALKYGAEVPFMRSEKNSDDFATTADVILEVLDKLKENGDEYHKACCIYPTAPFLTGKKLIESWELFNNSSAYSLISVCPFSYPIQRALKIENDKLEMIHPENRTKRSQDLMPTYHDSGQFYWFQTEHFYREKKMLMSNTVAYPLPELEVQDIDTPEDWEIAEAKYRILHNLVN
jgi:N-acylneuraminate cytidylyltransferase